MKKYVLFLFLFIFCAGTAQQVKIVPFKYNGQWGLMDIEGNEVLPPNAYEMVNVNMKFKTYIFNSMSYGTQVYNAETGDVMNIDGSYQKYSWDTEKYLFTTTEQTSFLYDFDKNEKIFFEGILKNVEILQINSTKYYLGKNIYDDTYTIYSYEKNPKILVKNITSYQELYSSKKEKAVNTKTVLGAPLGEDITTATALALNQEDSTTEEYSIYDSNLKYIGKSTLNEQKLSKLLKQKILLNPSYDFAITAPDSHYYIEKGKMISENLKLDTEGNLVDVRTGSLLISSDLKVNYRELNDGIIQGYTVKNEYYRGDSTTEFYIDTTGKYFPKEVPMLPLKYTYSRKESSP